MKLTKFTLTDEQFANFEVWLKQYYNYRKHGISLNLVVNQILVDRFLGHYYGVRMLNWMDKAFVTLTPANAGFFILAMSGKNG